nr:PREDICTED: uncharacterized protein LOC106494508 [Apteryx mantelli mantelli]
MERIKAVVGAQRTSDGNGRQPPSRAERSLVRPSDLPRGLGRVSIPRSCSYPSVMCRTPVLPTLIPWHPWGCRQAVASWPCPPGCHYSGSGPRQPPGRPPGLPLLCWPSPTISGCCHWSWAGMSRVLGCLLIPGAPSWRLRGPSKAMGMSQTALPSLRGSRAGAQCACSRLQMYTCTRTEPPARLRVCPGMGAHASPSVLTHARTCVCTQTPMCIPSNTTWGRTHACTRASIPPGKHRLGTNLPRSTFLLSHPRVWELPRCAWVPVLQSTRAPTWTSAGSQVSTCAHTPWPHRVTARTVPAGQCVGCCCAQGLRGGEGALPGPKDSSDCTCPEIKLYFCCTPSSALGVISRLKTSGPGAKGLALGVAGEGAEMHREGRLPSTVGELGDTADTPTTAACEIVFTLFPRGPSRQHAQEHPCFPGQTGRCLPSLPVPGAMLNCMSAS